MFSNALNSKSNSSSMMDSSMNMLFMNLFYFKFFKIDDKNMQPEFFLQNAYALRRI